jgi:hypothetical protein
MRNRARLAVTVLGFAALSGMGGTAHADSGGGLGLNLDLSGTLGKAGPLGKTVDGVVKNTLGSPSVHVKVPVHARVSTPRPARRSSPVVKPVVKADVKAGADVALSPLSVRAGVQARVCAGPLLACARRPGPPNPVPPLPEPPNPPPAPPPANKPAPASPVVAVHGPSSATLNVIGTALPFTGGPVGVLALLGVLAVVTGAAGVAASRLRR